MKLGCVGAVDIAVKSYDSASRSSLCLRVQGEELITHTRLCVISIAIYIAEKRLHCNEVVHINDIGGDDVL